MRKLLLFSLSGLFVTFVLFSCAQKEKTNTTEIKSSLEKAVPTSVKPGFTHAVYFWLKKDNQPLLDEFIKEGLPKLAKVESIQAVSWGPPAGTPREDVVDNSYDLAWIVSFDNAEDQDKYQVDPIHLAFVEKYKSLFEKVIVYDNIVENYFSK